MWMICSALSLVCCGIGWVLKIRERPRAIWFFAGSLALVGLTLLLEYQLVADWAQNADWSAVGSVAPSAFPMMRAYWVLMTLANLVPLFLRTGGDGAGRG